MKKEVLEVWKPIPNWPMYMVSNLGRIKIIERVDRLDRHWNGRMCKSHRHGPYAVINLKAEYRRRATIEVHRLVALAFLGERPKGMTVSHIDGNGHNNKLSNLLYETMPNNVARKVEHGTHNRGERHGNARLKDKEAEEIRQSSNSDYDLANKFGVSPRYIRELRKGHRRNYPKGE